MRLYSYKRRIHCTCDVGNYVAGYRFLFFAIKTKVCPLTKATLDNRSHAQKMKTTEVLFNCK